MFFRMISKVPKLLIRRAVVIGSTSGAIGAAYYNGVLDKNFDYQLSTLMAAKRLRDITGVDFRESLRMIRGGDLVIPRLAIQDVTGTSMMAATELVQFLMSNLKTTLPLVTGILCALVENKAYPHAWQFLAQCRTYQDLLLLSNSLPREQAVILNETLLNMSSFPKSTKPIEGFNEFLILCRENPPDLNVELFLFFVTSHLNSIISECSQEELATMLEAVLNVSLKDLARTRRLLGDIIEGVNKSIHPIKDKEQLRVVIPILVRILCMKECSERVFFASLIMSLAEGNRIDLESKSILRKLWDLRTQVGDELSLQLMDTMIEANPRMVAPEEVVEQLKSAFFKNLNGTDKKFDQNNSKRVLKVLSTIALKDTETALASLLQDIASSMAYLEQYLKITDYEHEQKQKALDSIMERRLDFDSELYAFHEYDKVASVQEQDLEAAGVIDLDRDFGPILQRVGILCEVQRNRCDALKSASTTSSSLINEYILRYMFVQVSQLLKSVSTELVSKNDFLVLRALANMATLSRYVGDSKARIEFLKIAHSDLFANISNGQLSIHGLAEFRRMLYNARSAPIVSAPVLIDSLLPLANDLPVESAVDFVFVHGLRGGLYTWRLVVPETEQKMKDSSRSTEVPVDATLEELNIKNVRLWPELFLGTVFPEKSRLLAFTFDAPLWYATHKQHYSEIEVKKDFSEMAASLRETLKQATGDAKSSSDKKIIFICFSMGGLVVKQALIDDPELRQKTKGIVFFATPHLGSPIADYVYYSPFVKGSLVPSFVAHLSTKSTELMELHQTFMDKCGRISMMAVCETIPSALGAGIKGMIVPVESCSACGGTVLEAGNDVDHEDVPKMKQNLMQKDERIKALAKFINESLIS